MGTKRWDREVAMADQLSDPSEDLRPTRVIDSDHPSIITFAAEAVAREGDPKSQAVALFYAVRDGIRYDPFHLDLSIEAMRASAVLARGFGFCIPKAVLLCAAARALGIPSRLRFADVRNHLLTPKLERLIGGDIMRYHGFTELQLDSHWVKVTPAFDRDLCERLGVPPLEFDGTHDALLQAFDRSGNRYLEYVHDYGSFADLPLETIREAFEWYHPVWLKEATGTMETEGT